MPRCAACGREMAIELPVGRRDECPHCGTDLRACRQCRFFDLYAPNQCREPQAEPVVDKEKANFCDFFSFAGGQGGGDGKKQDVKRKLEELFKTRIKD